MVIRGLLFIILGIGLLAFEGYLTVLTASLPYYIAVPLYDKVFNAYPAVIGVFFILWGYYTIRSDAPQSDA